MAGEGEAATGGKDGGAPKSGESTETRVAGSPTTSIMMAEQGGPDKPKAQYADSEGTVAEFDDKGGVSTRTGLGEDGGEDAEDAGDAGEDAGDADEGVDQGEGEDAADGEPVDLGDYDPEDDASVARYEEHFTTEKGGPDLQKLSAEWFKNAGDDLTKGALSEGTYKYLADKHGFSREDVKAIEAGQLARIEQSNQQVYDMAGGREQFEAAVAWGRENYTPAQRERFNAALASGDAEVQADAIEALTSRYAKETGGARGQRRPSKPTKDVTTRGSGDAAPQGYSTYAEWHADFLAAQKSGTGEKRAEVRAKLRASSWFSKGKAKA